MPARRTAELVDHLFREKSGQMVASLTRVLGSSKLDLAEEVVQESLLTALRVWPFAGVPDHPGGWLFRTAKNKAVDRLRHEAMTNQKLAEAVRMIDVMPDSDDGPGFASEIRDDQLAMMLMCCHPSLSRESRVALTLKIVGGFGVDEIASAFLSKREAIQQRIVRAKRQLREESIELRLPESDDLAARLDVVLDVLYLMFNEGYHATEGDSEVRADLCVEAMRLATMIVEHPTTANPKGSALLALMQLHASRLPARSVAGELTFLARQDRTLWNRRLIDAGLKNLDSSASGDELTAYHVEAAIAACHAVAPTWESTEWSRVVKLYDDLYLLKPTPVVRINRAIALSKVDGPADALRQLEQIAADSSLESYLPLYAALGELRAEVGDTKGSRESFQKAANLSRSTIVRRYLEERAMRS